MRKRYNKNGDVIGAHRMVFDEIPDNYKIKKVILEDKVQDLSHLSVMKLLRDKKVADEFDDDTYYSSEVLFHMALDYLESAILLRRGVANDRRGIEDSDVIVSHYTVPCAFLCKHSIELMLKRALLSQDGKILNGHKILSLWDAIQRKDFPHYDELRSFIVEVEKIDSNEMALRYGISKDLKPLSEKFKYDTDNLITNTMFMFNIIEEHVISYNTYKRS